MRIGLVGCVKTKGPIAAPAGELYSSALFTGRRRFVESACARWFILSARHGLLAPSVVIEPYDESLVDADAGERRAWSDGVLRSLEKELGDVSGLAFEVHAGAAYRDFGLVDGLRRRGAEVVVPAAGLSQGRQLAFYTASSGGDGTPPGSPSAPGGYASLGEWLAGRPGRRVTVSLAQLESVLGRPLPASARTHRPWWGNHKGNAQARAWLSAGWRVAGVNLADGQVTFERSS